MSLTVGAPSGVWKVTLPLLFLPIVLTACTGVRELRYTLHPAPNECQITEVRVTTMSTLTSGICWDGTGGPIGMVGGAGKPVIAVPLEIMGAAAAVAGPIGGAVILGQYMYKAGQKTSGITIPPLQGTVSGSVDVLAPPPLPALPPFTVPAP